MSGSTMMVFRILEETKEYSCSHRKRLDTFFPFRQKNPREKSKDKKNQNPFFIHITMATD